MLFTLADRGTGLLHTAVDRVRLRTRADTRFVDLTELLAERVRQSGIRVGLAVVQTLHTTAALTVNEHEPLLLGDLDEALARFAPAGLAYAHDDFERRGPLPPGETRNGSAHCRALALAASVTLLVEDGALVLGRWQRVLLVELDPPREREVAIAVLGREEPR